MSKKKLVIIAASAIICVIAILATILLIGPSKKQPDAEDRSGVSRADWITLLGQNFSLTTYEQNTPYYSDIPSGHTAFDYIQSCYEWGILRDKTVFKPDETASRTFVAETAMLAATLERNPSVVDMGADALLQLAYKEGILPSQSTTYGVTAAECEEIIQKLKEYYLGYVPEDYSNITLKKDVIDYSFAEIAWKDESVLVVPENIGASLSVGTIFLAPSDNPTGVARKVVSVSTINGQTEVETAVPELEEVFENLSFSYTGTPDLEDIVPLQEGVTIHPVADVVPTSSSTTGAKIVKLSSVTPLASGTKKDPISFGVDVNFTKGKLTPNIAFTDYFSVTAEQGYKNFFGKDISDDAGTLLKRTHTILKYDKKGNLLLDKTEEWKTGYEITGKLKVNNLYVESSCQTSGICKLETFNCELHFDLESSLSFKGKLEGSVPVFETVIPGPAGIYIKVVFSVYVDLNGEIAVAATIDHTSNVTYQNKKSKAVQNTKYETEVDIGADIASGVKGEVILSVVGIDLVDVSAKAGAGFEVGATAHKSGDAAMICTEGKCYFPTVSISIGSNTKTAAHKLGIKATLKLIDKSGALIKSVSRTLWHCEVTASGSNNVKKCTWDTYSAQGNGNSSAEKNPPETTTSGTQPSSSTPAEKPTDSNGKVVPLKLGDHIYFGSAVSGKEPEIWQVINVDGSYALIYNLYMYPGVFDATIHAQTEAVSFTRYNSFGSATWEYSDVRSWLNSRDTTVQYQDIQFDYSTGGIATVPWPSDKVPTYLDSSAGYLNRFTAEEYSIIQPVTHQSLIPYTQSGKSSVYDADLKDFTIDLHPFYQEPYGVSETTDLMFLLNGWEFKNYVLDNNLWGYNYPNGKSLANFWLRDSVNTDFAGFYGYFGTHMLTAGNGKAGSSQADSEAAIRPACYIDMSFISVLSGSGSFEDPYHLTIDPTVIDREQEAYYVFTSLLGTWTSETEGHRKDTLHIEESTLVWKTEWSNGTNERSTMNYNKTEFYDSSSQLPYVYENGKIIVTLVDGSQIAFTKSN